MSDDNISQLRRTGGIKIGDFVKVGTADSIFKVQALGHCGPKFIEGAKLINGDEFVQLAIPGHAPYIFEINSQFLRKVE